MTAGRKACKLQCKQEKCPFENCIRNKDNEEKSKPEDMSQRASDAEKRYGRAG